MKLPDLYQNQGSFIIVDVSNINCFNIMNFVNVISTNYNSGSFIRSRQIIWKGAIIENSSSATIDFNVDILYIDEFNEYLIDCISSSLVLYIDSMNIGGQIGTDNSIPIFLFTESNIVMLHSIFNIDSSELKNVISIVNCDSFFQNSNLVNITGTPTFYLSTDSDINIRIQKLV